MKFLALIIALSLPVFAADISADYFREYEIGMLDVSESESLKNLEVVLIPGIMSESFISDDHRGTFDFSIFTKDYFGTHLHWLKKQKITSRRLRASSADVEETKTEIDELFKTTSTPLLFITHSLGGMALLDYLLAHPESWTRVQAIAFLQSPFTGAPVATVVQRFPHLARVFPAFHVSSRVVHYLSLEERKDYVTKNEQNISELTSKVKVITVGGTANGYKSLYSNSVTLIKTGCLETFRGNCVGPKLYDGPYDDSDGMSPFQGTILPGADFVKIPGIDHGETVVRIPYKNINHQKLTAAILKLLL
jgi:predicted alpha/beta hydrolase family esterase